MKDKLNNIGVEMAVMVLASVVPAIVMMLLFRAYGVYGCEMKTLLLASLVMVAVVCACNCVIAFRLSYRSRNFLMLAASYLPFVLYVVMYSKGVLFGFLIFWMQFPFICLNVKYAKSLPHLLLYNFNTVFSISMSMVVTGWLYMLNISSDVGSFLVTVYSYYISAGVGLLVSLGALFFEKRTQL